jgi:hypothetical protein
MGDAPAIETKASACAARRQHPDERPFAVPATITRENLLSARSCVTHPTASSSIGVEAKARLSSAADQRSRRYRLVVAQRRDARGGRRLRQHLMRVILAGQQRRIAVPIRRPRSCDDEHDWDFVGTAGDDECSANCACRRRHLHLFSGGAEAGDKLPADAICQIRTERSDSVSAVIELSLRVRRPVYEVLSGTRPEDGFVYRRSMARPRPLDRSRR